MFIDNDYSLREKMPFSVPGSTAEKGVCSDRVEEEEGCQFLFLVLQIEIYIKYLVGFLKKFLPNRPIRQAVFFF